MSKELFRMRTILPGGASQIECYGTCLPHEVAAQPEQGRARRATRTIQTIQSCGLNCPDSRRYTAPKDRRLNERTLEHDEMPRLVQAPRYAGRQGQSARREALRGRVHD